jgi:RNA recognition motif-containing protein
MLCKRFHQVCGPLKSWKRAADPTSGKPKGFGFAEYETAEGVLRAMRLLKDYPLDGQELLVRNICNLPRIWYIQRLPLLPLIRCSG